jgi:formylglycine-generating enzyme required for sulfatase activity
MAWDAFISHSAKDKETADAVCASLEAAGVRCWIAPRDIRPGDTWANAIVGAIDASRVMVIVFSSHSNDSRQVVRELELAVRKDLVIVPFRIEAVRPSGDMDYFLSATHWLEAAGSDVNGYLPQLVEVVRSFLGEVEAETESHADPRSVRAVAAEVPTAAETSPAHRAPGSRLPEQLALGLVGALVLAAALWVVLAGGEAESPEPAASTTPVAEPVPQAGPAEPAPAEPAPPAATGAEGSVVVAAGDFFFGCSGGAGIACGSDAPQGRMAAVGEFAIDVREVSVAQFAACVEAGACREPATGAFCNWKAAGRESHPVNCVPWAEANAYCEWSGRRLPSELEWEKAARGTDRLVYPWGDEAATCERAVIDVRGSCGSPGTRPAGSHPGDASPYGVLDLAGNVQEWTADWYDARKRDRAVRGANWNSHPRAAVVWRRDPIDGKTGHAQVGFRCAQ